MLALALAVAVALPLGAVAEEDCQLNGEHHACSVVHVACTCSRFHCTGVRPGEAERVPIYKMC